MLAGQAAHAGMDHWSVDRNIADGMRVANDVVEQTGQNAGSEAISVAADAFASPADHGPDDQVASNFIDMRDDPADDGIVVWVAERISLAGQKATDKGFIPQVYGIDRLEYHQGVPGHSRALVVVLEPLHAPGDPGNEGRGRSKRNRQRLDQLGLALDVARQHAVEALHQAGSRLEAHAFRTLRRVGQLQRELMRTDLSQRRLRFRLLVSSGAFLPEERHGSSP